MSAAHVEYYGGPADGRTEQVPLNPLTGQPPAVRICKMAPGCATARHTEFFYERGPYRPDGVWVYRLRPAAGP